MTNAKPNEEEMMEVIELEMEQGNIESFVIMERLEHDNSTYVLTAPLKEVEVLDAMIDDMTEEQIDNYFSENELMLIMSEEEDGYRDLTEEEFEAVRAKFDEKIQETAKDD